MRAFVRRTGYLLFVFAAAAGTFAWLQHRERVFAWGYDLVHRYRENIDGVLAVADAGYWMPLAPGVERRVVRVTRGDRYPLSIYAVRFHPKKIRFGVVAPDKARIDDAPIEELVESARAVAMINGPFFAKDRKAVGLVIAAGKTISGFAPASDDEGVFFVRGGVPHLAHRDNFREHGVTEAVQSGPWLVRNGAPQMDFRNADRVTRRSAVGRDGAGHILFVATDTVISGITLGDLSHLLALPIGQGGFGCVDALNLDGGTSTQLVLRTRDDNHLVRGFVNVPVYLAAFDAGAR
ncbi:phosphodiester glycosidase family protein [bacterium]|nr:phosphodiester glycosidase family protein [bacterium]